MRRVKPAKSLESAKFLLLKRRLLRHLPRHPARLLAGAGTLILIGVVVAGAADRLDNGSRLERAMLATTATLGLRLESVEVEGRDETTADEVLRAAGASRGEPLLAISPARARAALEALPWVKSAVVERRVPDTLSIRLTERSPLALWQLHGRMVLIDTDGMPIATDHLERFSDLLLVVGEGAATHAKALIDVLAAQPDLMKHVTAAVRVGDRRWNLQVDHGVDIELPETGVADAWNHFAELERNHAVLARDIERVDLRLADRVVVKPAPEPAKPAPAPGHGKAAKGP